MKKLLLSAFAIIALSAISFGQATATAAGTIKAGITITNTNSTVLNFGTIVATATTDGSVVMNTTSLARESTGSGIILSGSSESFAQFDLAGPASAPYTVTLPADGFIITDGTHNMTINSFTCDASTGNLGVSDGKKTIKVGATLVVKDLTINPAGIYTSASPFTVTLNYN